MSNCPLLQNAPLAQVSILPPSPAAPRLPTLWNPSRRSNCVCMSIRGWKPGPKSTQPALVTWAKRCSGDLPQRPPGSQEQSMQGEGRTRMKAGNNSNNDKDKRASNGARQAPFTHWTVAATLQTCSNTAQPFWFFHFAPRGYVFKNWLLVTWLQSLKIDIKFHINLMVYKVLQENLLDSLIDRKEDKIRGTRILVNQMSLGEQYSKFPGQVNVS